MIHDMLSGKNLMKNSSIAQSQNKNQDSMSANARFRSALLQPNPFSDILGQEQVKRSLKSALLANRNILIVGPAGVGKTTLAKSVAKILPKDPEGKPAPFIRLQGSPDLTVEDMLGDIDPIKALKYGPLSSEAFSPGKIFKADGGVLFFDELNRAPEKLQNALLEVLEEHIATLGTYEVDFPVNFIFIATMNPYDASTEKISDVLLDRFDVVYMSYPETKEIEKSIVKMKAPVVEGVLFPEPLLDLTVLFVRSLRENSILEKVPSVRATIGLHQRAQSNAALESRKTVEFKDIEEAIISVLAHRMTLKPSAKYLQSPREFVEEQLARFKDKNNVQKDAQKGGLR